MITLWGQGALAAFNPLVPDFSVPFADLGSGVVNLTPSAGSGSGTFSRTGVAWTKLASGLWASVADSTPRSRYWGEGTAVGSYGGLFLEAAGVQLITPTASIRDMTDVSWVKTTMTTAKTSTGIDGAANSCTRLTAAGANSLILQTLVAAASSRTYSCFIKRVTGTGNIELTQDGTTFTNISGSLNSSTFTRVQLNASQLNASFGIRIVTNADAIDVDFNQFEAGIYATSPMAAAGAARNADSLTYLGTNVSATQGTCYAEVELPVAFGLLTGGCFVSSDAGNNGRVLLKAAGQAITSIAVNDGTTQLVKTGLPDLTSQVVKTASAWSGATQSVTGNNLAAAGGAFDGSMGNASVITIGSNGGGAEPINGTVMNLKIWKSRASDTQLQALTV